MHNTEGRLLLLELHEGLWDIPGGRLKKGETLLEALKREVKEETGFCNLQDVYPMTTFVTSHRILAHGGDVGLILSVFRCKIDSSFQPLLSNEHVNFGWFTPTEAAQKLSRNYPAEFIDKLIEFQELIEVNPS